MAVKVIPWDGCYSVMTRQGGVCKEVVVPSYPRLYFHPDSETLLAVDQCDWHDLEQESNRLTYCLAQRADALQRIEQLQKDVTTLGWVDVPERNRFQNLLKDEYRHLDEACQTLRAELAALTPTENLPAATLLDENSKKNALGLMELIDVMGGKNGTKYVYVRSDKIRSHWRRYRLNSVEKKSGGKSFLRAVEYTGKDGHTHTRHQIDPEKLKGQLAKLKPSMKAWEVKLLDDNSGVWSLWAQEFNQSLEHSPYEGSGMAFDAQAQLLRWAYGASMKGLLNPFEIDIRTGRYKPKAELHGKTSVYANLALAEAKSSGKLHLPDNVGVKICYPLDPAKIPGGGMGILGTFRFDIELTLSGSVGASLGIEAGVNITGDRAKGLPVKAMPDEGYGFWRQIDVTKEGHMPLGGGAELGVFVGAEAGANVSGALVWLNPDRDEKYSTLAKVGMGGAAQAGGGLSGQLKFRWQDGKVRIEVSGGLCWGTGGKGSMSFEVDGPAIMSEFMPCLTYMLRNADYIRLMQIMMADDYYAFCAIPLLVGMYGINRVIDAGGNIAAELKKSWDKKESRVALMTNILNTKGDCLKFTPPESKGAAIAALIDTNLWDNVASPVSHGETTCEGGAVFSARKRAIIYALRWVQSQREYENVMQHLSKMPGEENSNWRINEQRVIAFLAQGETPKTYGFAGSLVPAARNITIEPSHYADNLRNLYLHLPEAPAIPPGHINMSTLPLREVLPTYLHSCTRLIYSMHGDTA
ncbi:hypothetical protein [Enterobacter asburiae]|uniref:hypothetical protein n=1 Tax=Enterobacter asburiae TaxID=61645 RepID=UPI003EB797C9